MTGERFERHRALVEDIAYGGISAQEIAEKYGLSLEESNSSLPSGAKDEVADGAEGAAVDGLAFDDSERPRPGSAMTRRRGEVDLEVLAASQRDLDAFLGGVGVHHQVQRPGQPLRCIFAAERATQTGVPAHEPARAEATTQPGCDLLREPDAPYCVTTLRAICGQSALFASPAAPTRRQGDSQHYRRLSRVTSRHRP